MLEVFLCTLSVQVGGQASQGCHRKCTGFSVGQTLAGSELYRMLDERL